jgi:EmrB/QacA subfamily drug resistance transporter
MTNAPASTAAGGRLVSAESSDDGHPARWWIMAVLAAVAFMAQLDLFIVNVALPTIGASYHGASLSGLSWVLNAYAIIFAALLVPAGRLADHFGRRRFLLIGVLIFTLASAACAAAPTLGVLVAARAVQAIGAALIVPTSLGLLYPAFPKRQHAMVVGVWAGVAAVAGTAGPPIGGLLVGVDWRWIFLINVPIGVATLVAGLRVLPEVRAVAGSRLPDWVSSVLLLAAVTLLVLGTVQGPVWGWGDAKTIVLLVVAALAIAATVARTVRNPHALIERDLFASRAFTGASVALLLYFVGFAIFLLSVVLFLQGEWHYSAVKAGLAIAPGPATAAVFAVNAGRIRARFGRTVPAVAGTLFMVVAAGYWALFTGAAPDYPAAFLPGLFAGGISAGLVQAPLFAAAGTLPPNRATTGSAVLTMARQVGSAIGVAVVVVILGTAAVHPVAAYHHVWLAEVIAALAACLAVVATAGQTPERAPSY